MPPPYERPAQSVGQAKGRSVGVLVLSYWGQQTPHMWPACDSTRTKVQCQQVTSSIQHTPFVKKQDKPGNGSENNTRTNHICAPENNEPLRRASETKLSATARGPRPFATSASTLIPSATMERASYEPVNILKSQTQMLSVHLTVANQRQHC